MLFFCRNNEVARTIAHASVHIAGVLGIQECYVDKLHWLTIVIQHSAYQLPRLLLNALEVYFVLIESGMDGIKAYQLADDIMDVLVDK